MTRASDTTHTCPSCLARHGSFEDAAACCKADFVICPLEELPADAELGGGEGRYGYGTVFTGRWELALNGTPDGLPVRVYPLPPLMSKMVMELAKARYEQGVSAARADIRRALGV